MAREVTDRPPGVRRAPLAGRIPRRHADVVTALTLVVVLAAVVVRLAFLRNQSYWTDEIFAVREASGTLSQLFSTGRYEIHTPLYVILLWAWEHIGGTSTIWTHALSAVFGLAAVVAAHVCLRGAGLSDRARRLAVALTAASGFGIVYSQETRPYALVLLGVTGLTAVTLRRVVTPRCSALSWLAWALLTATAHLLGAVLVGVTALLLAVVAWRQRRAAGCAVQLGLGVLAVLPQVAWIITGIGRPGFAAGTDWILVPRGGDVWLLLTSVFPSGGLTPRSDGFAWTSPVGVIVAVGVLAVAAALAARGRSRPAEPPPPDETSTTSAAPTLDPTLDLRLGLVLLAVAAATLAGTFAVSQLVHLWTLRNMIVVVPSLTWGAAWVAAALPRTANGRRAVAVAVLVATLASLGAVAENLRHPYKTDWRALLLYLSEEQTARADTTFSFFGSEAQGALVADDRDRGSDPHLQAVVERAQVYPRAESAIPRLRRAPGPQVVVYYAGVGHPTQPGVRREILRQLGDVSCRTVPIYGLVVVSCP